MTIDLQRFRATFLEEAAEHLATLEDSLLRLEGGTEASADLLDGIFRAVHSIKGSCGIFGFSDVAHFAHELETVLDRLRSGSLAVSRDLVDLLLRSGDHLRELLAAAAADQPMGPDAGLLAGLAAFLDRPATTTASAAPQTPEAPAPRAYRVDVRPRPELLRSGLDAFLLVRDLSSLGTVTHVAADTASLPVLEELEPERCYLHWSLTLHTEQGESAIRDVFAFVDDVCDVAIRELAATPAAPLPLPAAGGVSLHRTQSRELGSLRVSTDKVDALVNLVGELIISQAMANQVMANFSVADLPLLAEALDSLDRNIRDLQDRVLAIRMVPLGDLFSRFPRVVRDLAVARDKQIDLVIEGEETELDKGVVEQIADPLTHLIRNAIDHGVEPASKRVAAGKPARATIRLSAATEAGNVVIEVADDGRGLDREAILAKALAAGLIADDVALGDAEIDALIFAPGFSTAETVTDISGRGVGMDVVRRNIESLGGAVSVHTQRGRGTTLRIRLPLTLAILDGMQIRVGRQTFVLPLHSVVESFRPTATEVQTVLGHGEVARVRGETLPLIRLERALGVPDAVKDTTRGLLTVVEHKSRRFALLCDEVLGQSQIVIKNLESNYRRVDGVLGATILGDGRVALILDLASLTDRALAVDRQPQYAALSADVNHTRAGAYA